MGHMDLDLYKNIIDQIEGKVEAVTLASRGEPTLHPKLPEMLDYLSNKFLEVKLNTNATRLNEKLIRKNWVGISVAVVSILLIMSVNG